MCAFPTCGWSTFRETGPELRPDERRPNNVIPVPFPTGLRKRPTVKPSGTTEAPGLPTPDEGAIERPIALPAPANRPPGSFPIRLPGPYDYTRARAAQALYRRWTPEERGRPDAALLVTRRCACYHLEHGTMSTHSNDTTQSEKVTLYLAWCKRCGNCVAFCPKHALDLDAWGYPYIAHPERCAGCGLCEKLCPDFAIGVEDVDQPSRPKRTGKARTRASKPDDHYPRSPERLAAVPSSEEEEEKDGASKPNTDSSG